MTLNISSNVEQDMDLYAEAYKRGKQAYYNLLADLPNDECPYAQDSIEYKWWKLGFAQEQQDWLETEVDYW